MAKSYACAYSSRFADRHNFSARGFEVTNMSEQLKAILRVRKSVEGAYDSPKDEIRLSFDADGKTVALGPAPPTFSQQRYSFDKVYTQGEDVYSDALKQTVDSTLLGYNGTLLSLEVGGTGSSLQNIIGSAADQIFLCLKKSKTSRSAFDLVVNCSYVAVAKERAYDLLGGDQATFDELPMVDNLPQASVQEVKSTSQALGLLEHGRENEQKVVNRLNLQHSHKGCDYHHTTVLSLTVEYSHFGSMNSPVSGTLSFVRLPSTHPLAHRDQYTTGGELDQSVISLLALADVINTLGSQVNKDTASMQEETVEELYSKSLLTQLLKETIGGNCKTVFMCDIHRPIHESNLPEITAALQLVSSARAIQNRPNKRDLAEKALMTAYMTQLKRQYEMTGRQNETGMEQSDEKERQQAMELAATALAQAVDDGPKQSIDRSEEENSPLQVRHPHTKKISVVTSPVRKSKERMMEHGGPDSKDISGASGVTIDALVGVLQDPDRGVPRALETRLKDVKIRRDVGALFSGAGIVEWMLENVEGVKNETDAVTLGQLLLDEGAIFHSEGSMVFANADSLFYYAREARLGKRLLSPEEIQALLSHVRETDDTIVKEVDEKHQFQEDEDDINGQSFGFNTSRAGCEDRQQLDSGNVILQASGGFNLSTSLNEDQLTNDNTDSVFEYTAEQVESSHAEMIDGEPNENSHDAAAAKDSSQVSVESWMAAEKDEMTGENEAGNPNTILQQSLPSIHTLENSYDYPHPLHMSVAVGKQPGVIRNLVMMFGVDQTDTRGRTPLMFAALGNKRASCTTLIECGAICDKQDESGLTALHVACYHGSKEAARVLLSKKATVNITDKMGHTALHWSIIPESTACLQLLLHYMWPAVLKQVDKSGLTALHWAIFYNRPHHLKLLLKKCSEEIELDSSGRTLLTYAIEREPPTADCINVLTEMCPQLLTQADANSRLPLHMAAIATSPVPLNLLLLTTTTTRSHTKSPIAIDINCIDPLERTPLHYAAAANRLENVQILLSVGANQLSVDSEGRTPLDYASLLENGATIVKLLEEQHQQQDLTHATTSTNRPVTAAATDHITTTDQLHSTSTHSLPTQLLDNSNSKVCTIL